MLSFKRNLLVVVVIASRSLGGFRFTLTMCLRSLLKMALSILSYHMLYMGPKLNYNIGEDVMQISIHLKSHKY